MRIYISVDMEGISGVTRWQDVAEVGQDYQRARSWMTGDVNAVVAGAREAGATGFVVEENHGVEMLCNLLLDEIDPAVDVVRGFPRGGPTTAAALETHAESLAGLYLVGHHAKAGERIGFCAHTISYGDYARVRLDGRVVGEGEIFARIAAQRGVPTALVAGDDVVCAEMASVCPGIETAVVKTALSRTGGWIIPPVRAREIIRAAAERATRRLAAGDFGLMDATGPVAMEVELRQPIGDEQRASIADRHPEFTIVGDRTLAFEHEDMAVAYRMAAVAGYVAQNGFVASY